MGNDKAHFSHPFWQFLFILQCFQYKGRRFHVNENVSEKCILLCCFKVLAIVCFEAKLLYSFFEVEQLPCIDFTRTSSEKWKKLKQHELHASSLFVKHIAILCCNSDFIEFKEIKEVANETLEPMECTVWGVFLTWSEMKREIPLLDAMEMSSSEPELCGSLDDVSKSPKYPASFDRSLMRWQLSFSALQSAWLMRKENNYDIKRLTRFHKACVEIEMRLFTFSDNNHKLIYVWLIYILS